MLLIVSGCAQLMGTAGWDSIEVSNQAGSTQNQLGNYSLVVTAAELKATIDDQLSSTEMPPGAWDALVAGVRTLGGRASPGCPGGQFIQITAKAGEVVKQTYQASSCDAGDALKQAQQVVEGILKLLK